MKKTCRGIQSLLPWFLNESLSAEEHETIEHHLSDCPNCARALVETEKVGAFFNSHIPADLIVAKALDTIQDRKISATIDKHLMSCEDCAEALALARQSQKESGLTAAPEPTESSRWRSLGPLLPMAAMLTLGFGFVIWWILGMNNPADTPQVLFHHHRLDIFPSDALRSSPPQWSESDDVKGLILTLHCQLPRPPVRLDVELKKDADQVIWREQNVSRDRDGNLSVILPLDFLNQGGLSLDLLKPGTDQILENYRLEWEQP